MKNKLALLLVTFFLFSAFKADKPAITIFMIGDSTMANKKLDGGNPERGWGHVLPGFFSEDIASVKMNDKWGYVDTQGKWVIEPRFEEVQEFTTPNIAAAKLDGLWGIVQKDGSWLISPTWKTEPDLTLYTGGRYETGDSSQNILAPIIRVDGYLLNEKGEKLPHYVNSMLDGKVALHSGNKASAIAAFEQALTYIPNDQGALFGIKQANAL